MGSVLGLGIFPGGGNCSPLLYSCLPVYWVAKSQTLENTHPHPPSSTTPPILTLIVFCDSYFDSFLLLAWTLYTWVILLHSLLNGWFSSMNDCHTKSVQGSEMMIEPPSCHSGGWVRDSSLNSAFIFPQLKHFSCLVSLVFSFQHSTLTVTNNMRNSSPWHYSWIWKNLIKKSNHTHSLSRNTSALFWNLGNFSLHFSA